MHIIELVLISIGLAMDAFAVSICKGLAMRTHIWKKALVTGLYFGIAQAVMPLLGYLLGVQFAVYIEAFDHWVAFVLLGFIGGKMIWESLHSKGEDCGCSGDGCAAEPVLTPAAMLPLAIATSIDALAMGISFAVLGVSIAPAVTVIGLITLVICVAGVWVGRLCGSRFQHRAELLGGVILVLIGCKILLEHLGVLA